MSNFLRDNWPLLAAPLLGLVAVCFLLPRPKRLPVLVGAASGVAALVLAGFFIVRVGGIDIETFLFYVFSAIAVLAGGLLITQRNPARAALSFALVILATCGLFLLQAGPFLMAATIIVYAGAIIVTFLFVIMLAQQQGLSDADARSREPFLASLTGMFLLGALLYVLRTSYLPDLDRWVKRSEEKLERIRQSKNATDNEKRRLFTELSQFCADYDRWLRNEWAPEDKSDNRRDRKRPPPQAGPLLAALDNAVGELPASEEARRRKDLVLVEAAFDRLHQAGLNTQKDPTLGGLRPTSPSSRQMSELSGPRPGRPVSELRRDEEGRPHLPAENTTYLGRSLFGDYLLAVELAGMLLLVATVGAIAIATRRSAGKIPPAGANGPARGRTA